MITGDSIKKLPSCADLTPDQIADIELLSKNDEERVISDKTRDWYKNWDKDIFERTGIEKGPTEKTYEYHKRAWDETTNKLSSLQSEHDALKAKAKEGMSAEDKLKLKDLHDEIAALKSGHQKEIESLNGKLSEKDAEIQSVFMDAELMTVLSGVTFDETIDPEVRSAYVEKAISKIKSEYKMEVIVENGVRKIQWRDKNDSIVRNPDNKENPITTAELITPRISSVLQKPRKSEGSGADPKRPGEGGSAKFENKARTQTEFTAQATEFLLKSGVERGSKDFTEKLNSLWTEHKASSLPFQKPA